MTDIDLVRAPNKNVLGVAGRFGFIHVTAGGRDGLIAECSSTALITRTLGTVDKYGDPLPTLTTLAALSLPPGQGRPCPDCFAPQVCDGFHALPRARNRRDRGWVTLSRAAHALACDLLADTPRVKPGDVPPWPGDGEARIELSIEAQAAIAGVLAHSGDEHGPIRREDIRVSERVRAEITAAFPLTAFYSWLEGNPDVYADPAVYFDESGLHEELRLVFPEALFFAVAATPEPAQEAPGSRTVTVSHEAHAVIAGVMAPSNKVNPGGVHSGAFDEIYTAFPVADFWAWAGNDPGRYDPQHGW